MWKYLPGSYVDKKLTITKTLLRKNRTGKLRWNDGGLFVSNNPLTPQVAQTLRVVTACTCPRKHQAYYPANFVLCISQDIGHLQRSFRLHRDYNGSINDVSYAI